MKRVDYAYKIQSRHSAELPCLSQQLTDIQHAAKPYVKRPFSSDAELKQARTEAWLARAKKATLGKVR